MKIKPFTLGALIVVLVTGCSRSIAPRYYTLSPVALDSKVSSDRAGTAYSLGSITLPAYLTTPQMISRLGENEIALDEYNRWGEDLKEGFERTLSTNLATILGPVFASGLDSSSAAAKYEINVDIVRFEVDPTERAVMDVRWLINRRDSGSVVTTRSAVLIAPAERPDWPSRTKALSKVVGDLASEIAGSVQERR